MRDLAIDEHTGKVVYLVVSVGSFLIENNLIAVAPDALVPAGTDDGVYCCLPTRTDSRTQRGSRAMVNGRRKPM